MIVHRLLALRQTESLVVHARTWWPVLCALVTLAMLDRIVRLILMSARLIRASMVESAINLKTTTHAFVYLDLKAPQLGLKIARCWLTSVHLPHVKMVEPVLTWWMNTAATARLISLVSTVKLSRYPVLRRKTAAHYTPSVFHWTTLRAQVVGN